MVQEIVRPEGLKKVASAPAHVLGVVKRRGRLVPIIDMGRRLGLAPRPETPETCAIVVRLPVGVAGLLVDAARELLWVRTQDFCVPSPILADQSQVYLMGMAHLGDRFLTMLDVEALFTPGEQAQMQRLPPSRSSAREGA